MANPITGQDIKNKVEAFLGQQSAADQARCDQLAVRRTQSFQFPDFVAGTDIADYLLMKFPAAAQLVSVTITPMIAVVASDTVFETLVLNKSVAGAADVTAASINTSITLQAGSPNFIVSNVAKWVGIPVPILGTAASAFAIGDTLSITKTHASTGTAVGGATPLGALVTVVYDEL